MIKLSICMMVKNEQKNLRRCLESLNKLVNEIESEIIIVDTGSSDNTVAIAREYTDNIFHHVWNQNFSEMRNITINYAKGTWIFIIDADEMLVDPEPIIEFLNTKQNENIVGAAIFLKNAKNYEGTEFGAELITPRIFKKSSGIRYEGTVHNMPVVNGQLLEVKSTLHHFGYIQSDVELMEQKFIRTKKLIEDALAKDPDNIYYNFQLSVTYDMHKDFKEAYYQIKKTYEKIIEKNYSLNDYLYIYSSYAKVAMSQELYSEVVKICTEGLSLNEEYLDLYFFIAGANLRLGYNEQGLEDYKKYLKLVNSFNTLRIRQNSSIQHYTLNMIEEAYCNSCIVSYKLELFDYSLQCAQKVIGSVDETSPYYQAVFEVYLNLLIRDKNTIEIGKWYCSLKKFENKNITITMIILKLISSGDDLFIQLFPDYDFFNDTKNNVVNLRNKTDSNAFEYFVIHGYYLYLSLVNCNFDLFKSIEKIVSSEVKNLILENFFINHMPQNTYRLFFEEFKSDDSILGIYFKLLYFADNNELIMNYELSNDRSNELLTFKCEYYKIAVTILLQNSHFVNYLSNNVSDTHINDMLIVLASNEMYLYDKVMNALNLYDDLYIDKMGWSRVFRYYLKTLLTIDNSNLNWGLLERYHNYLLEHLTQKYQVNYINDALIENFSNNEEAYGVALIRSGYFKQLNNPKWLLTASELLPMTSKYLKEKLNTFSQELEASDELETELKSQILKLFAAGDVDSAFMILNEGLKLRPQSGLLLRLKVNLENQMN